MKPLFCIAAFLLTSSLYGQSHQIRISSPNEQTVCRLEPYGRFLYVLLMTEDRLYNKKLSVVKVDSMGNVVWNLDLYNGPKYTEGKDLLLLGDTAYILADIDSKLYLVGVSGDGTAFKQFSFEETAFDPKGLFRANSGIGLAGSKNDIPEPVRISSRNRSSPAFLMLDRQLNVLDSTSVSLRGRQVAWHAEPYPGNKLLMAGMNFYDTRQPCPFVGISDRAGNLKWIYSPPTPISEFTEPRDVMLASMSADNILLAWSGGNYNNKYKLGEVVCLDSLGHEKWKRKFDYGPSSEVKKLLMIDSSRFLILGEFSTDSSEDEDRLRHNPQFCALLDGRGNLLKETRDMPAGLTPLSDALYNNMVVTDAADLSGDVYESTDLLLCYRSYTDLFSGNQTNETAHSGSYNVLEDVSLNVKKFIDETSYSQGDEPTAPDWVETDSGYFFTAPDQEEGLAVFGVLKNGTINWKYKPQTMLVKRLHQFNDEFLVEEEDPGTNETLFIVLDNKGVLVDSTMNLHLKSTLSGSNAGCGYLATITDSNHLAVFDRLQTRRFETALDDTVSALTVDPRGSILIATSNLTSRKASLFLYERVNDSLWRKRALCSFENRKITMISVLGQNILLSGVQNDKDLFVVKSNYLGAVLWDQFFPVSIRGKITGIAAAGGNYLAGGYYQVPKGVSGLLMTLDTATGKRNPFELDSHNLESPAGPIHAIAAGKDRITVLLDSYSSPSVLTIGENSALTITPSDRLHLSHLASGTSMSTDSTLDEIIDSIPQNLSIKSFKPDGNGGIYVLAGLDGEDFSSGLIAHFDKSGKKTEIMIHGIGNVWLSDIIPDKDGNLLAYGNMGFKGLAIRLDRALNPLWQRFLDPGGKSYINSLVAGDTSLVAAVVSGESSYIYRISYEGVIRGQVKLDGYVFDSYLAHDTVALLSLSSSSSNDRECYDPTVINLTANGKMLASTPTPGLGCRYFIGSAVETIGNNGRFVLGGRIDLFLDSAYKRLFGNSEFNHAAIVSMNRHGDLLWQKAIGFQGWNTCNVINRFPDNRIIAALYFSEDSVNSECMIVLLSPNGDFICGHHLPGIKEIKTIAPANDGKILLYAIDQQSRKVILETDPAKFYAPDPFVAGANQRIIYYLNESQKIDQQITNQSTIDKEEPFDIRISTPMDDTAAMRQSYQYYSEEMKQYAEKRKSELVIDQWTDPSQLLNYSLRLINLAKEEVDSGGDHVLPALKAMIYRAYGLKIIESNPGEAAISLRKAFEIASTIYDAKSIYLTDYYEALKTADLADGDLASAELKQRKIVNIFELNQPLVEPQFQVLYLKSLNYLALLYVITNRISDAEQILNKAIKYSRHMEDGDILATETRLLLAGIWLRKGINNQQAIQNLVQPIREYLTDIPPALSIEFLNLTMVMNYYNRDYDKVLVDYYQIMNKMRELYGGRYTDVSFSTELIYLRALRLSGDIFTATRTAYEIINRHSRTIEKAELPYIDYELALSFQQEHQLDSALIHIRKAALLINETGMANTSNQESQQLAELLLKPFFTDYLSILQDTIAKVDNPRALFEESLTVAQKGNQSSTSASIAVTTEKFRQKDNQLGNLLRTEDSLSRKLTALDTKIRALMATSSSRNPRGQVLLREFEGLNTKYKTLHDELNKEFPQFADLTEQNTVNLGEIKHALDESEAVIMFHVGDSISYGWVITSDKETFFPIDLKRKEVEDLIMRIRATCEPRLNGTKGIGGVASSPNKQSGILGQLLKFDIRDSYQLYLHLLKPIEPYLITKKHLLIVPSGPLYGLPFGLLLTASQKPVKGISDFASMPWLALQFGISIWPSLASIKELRSSSPSSIGNQLPFVGFGDPAFAGPAGDVKGISLNMLFRNSDKIVNQETLHKLPRLPETAEELRKIAQSLGASERYVFLGKDANEQTVKSLDLTKFRVIAFSTHGFAAGEVQGIAEPALALTPPVTATTINDGLLTASEIAQLNTKAYWVILSACNTASSDGTKGSDNLSGLARAFFYSGSKSLLVTHWPVASAPTEILITKTLEEMRQSSELSKDEALKLSIKALLLDKQHPIYAHPMFWAPFVIVGEGRGREGTTVAQSP